MEGNAVGRALENIATQNAVRSPDYQSTGASFFSSSNQFMPMTILWGISEKRRFVFGGNGNGKIEL
jgi:hypothetical protein